MTRQVPVLPIADLPEGAMRAVRAAGHVLLLVNIGGTIHAYDDLCPHAGAPLHTGRQEGGLVTCPLHGSQFDLATGALRRGPATSALQRHETAVADGWVTVTL
jgi:nitrite reductase/ring-hydroxylating ferredoxin subunit